MSRRGWTITAAVLIAAIHLALLSAYYQPTTKRLAGDERSYRKKALVLAEGGQLEPDLWPPLYAYALAVPLAVADGKAWPMQLVQVALLLLIALLLRDIAARVIGRRGASADLAGLLVLIYPPLVAFAHYLWPEILHMALLIGALWIVVARRSATRWMPLLGLLLGLAVLAKSLILAFLPILFLPILFAGDRGLHDGRLRKMRPRNVARAALAAAVLTATLVPTLLANQRAHDRLTIATSGWFNLWVGLQDQSRRSLVDSKVLHAFRAYQASADDPAGRDAVIRREIIEYVERRGITAIVWRQLKVQYFRLLDKDSYFTAQLPGGDLHSVRQGYGGERRPFTETLRWLSYLFYGLLLAAVIGGLVVSRPRDQPWLWLIMAFLAYNALLFLGLHVKSRFRVQLLPFFFLYAGVLLDWWVARRAGDPAGQMPPRWRQLAGVVGVIAVWFLAFGAPLLE